MLDFSKRTDEAEELIQQSKAKLGNEVDFVVSWARHALRGQNKTAASEITTLPVIARLRPSLAALLYIGAGRLEQAGALAQPILSEVAEREVPARDLDDLAGLFREIGRWEEFEKVVARTYPAEIVRDLRERPGKFRRR